MNCPKCNSELVEIVKHGIALDNCTSCGGIRLDKGELGKIMRQLKQAEEALDEELTPLWKEKSDPAIVVIPIGLGILATEFVWAGRLLKTITNRIQTSKGGMYAGKTD